MSLTTYDYAGYVKTPDGREGLRYESFISPLIKSIQELSSEIKSLKAEINYIKCGSLSDGTASFNLYTGSSNP